MVDLFKNVPGEEVFNEVLSYSCDTPVVSQVQGRHLEPGGRGGGALHARPIVHNPGLVILNEIVLSLRVDFSNYEKSGSRAKFLDKSEGKSFTERVLLNCDDNLLVLDLFTAPPCSTSLSIPDDNSPRTSVLMKPSSPRTCSLVNSEVPLTEMEFWYKLVIHFSTQDLGEKLFSFVHFF